MLGSTCWIGFYGSCRCDVERGQLRLVDWRFSFLYGSASIRLVDMCVMKYIRPALLDRNDDASSSALLCGRAKEYKKEKKAFAYISLYSPSSGYITYTKPLFFFYVFFLILFFFVEDKKKLLFKWLFEFFSNETKALKLFLFWQFLSCCRHEFLSTIWNISNWLVIDYKRHELDLEWSRHFEFLGRFNQGYIRNSSHQQQRDSSGQNITIKATNFH